MKYHVAIFVDGEFWHGHDWENKKHKLKRNKEYWVEKIEENIARDQRVDRELRAMEWKPIHFWTKEVAKCASYTIAMTGTPIPNTYLDIYNLLHILYNDEYMDFFGFDTAMLKDPSIADIDIINDKIQRAKREESIWKID